jgi:hypothetical protein
MTILQNSKPVSDENGFWVVDHFQPGRGGSSVTYAHHCFGDVWLNHFYYQPGPWDHLFPEKYLRGPESTYSVWSGFALDQDEGDIETWSPKQLKKAVGPIPSCATLEIWNPDGEGAVYVCFRDEDVEDAIKYAKSRSQLA